MGLAGRASSTRRSAAVAGILGVVLATLASGAAAGESPGGAAPAVAAAKPPNFLLILVDDQAMNSFKRRYMPHTFAHLVDHGTTFTNGLAAPPLCCPDRAGIITGQYPHDNGVFSNHPGYAELNDPGNTLPVWLDRAGYRTAIFGKFLNHYEDVAGATPAPGFDRWFEVGDSQYYGYRASEGGTMRHFGHRRSDYSTDVLTRKALRYLREPSTRSNPFFLWLSYTAPHLARVRAGPCRGRNPEPPGRAAYRRFKHVPLPRPPSFNEADVSDKPAAIRSLPRLDRSRIKEVRLRWRCTLGTMSQVDRGVGKVMARLRDEGELSDTIVIYMSDNGFFFGEHRLRLGKGYIYEPALQVPYAVRVPAAYRNTAQARRVPKVVSNEDLAPSLLDYIDRYGGHADSCAGAGDCRRMDGRSLRPLLGGSGDWPRDRGVLAEIDTRKAQPGTKRNDPECNCAYEAIRTRRYLYSELSTGEKELYDLREDPSELDNLAGSPSHAGIEQQLAARLDLLRHCSGIEGRDPPTASPYCE